MNIQKNETGIEITIPCSEPAATHAQLMQSKAANIEYSSQAEEKHGNYADEMIPIIRLMKVLLPDAKRLERAFENMGDKRSAERWIIPAPTLSGLFYSCADTKKLVKKY